MGLSPAEMRNLLAGFAEETVVVGFRAEPRSATGSAVPVDVLSAADLGSRGAGDLNHQLRTIEPQEGNRLEVGIRAAAVTPGR